MRRRHADVLEQERQRADRADRARRPLARVLRRRSVDRLEHRHPARVDVAGASGAEAAADRGTEVGDDVAEEVRGDDDAELLGLLHEPHAGRINVHRVRLHVGILLRDRLEDLAPELLDRHGVRFVDEGDLLAIAEPGALEGVARDPLDPAAGEDHVDGDALVRRALAGPGAFAAVHVLGVLAQDEDVDVLLGLVLQRGEPRVVQDERPEVDVEVESPAEPEDDVRLEHASRDARVTHRTEQHRVERAHRLQGRGVEAPAVSEELLAGPIEDGALGREAEAGLTRVEHQERRLDDLGPDPVATEDPDLHHPSGRAHRRAAAFFSASEPTTSSASMPSSVATRRSA